MQTFAPDGSFIASHIGDAERLAKWQQQQVDANADVIKARRRVYSLEPEWRLTLPTAVEFDSEKSRLFVADASARPRSDLQQAQRLHRATVQPLALPRGRCKRRRGNPSTGSGRTFVLPFPSVVSLSDHACGSGLFLSLPPYGARTTIAAPDANRANYQDSPPR